MSDYRTVGYQGLAKMDKEAQDALAFILDFVRDCMDVLDIAFKSEILGYGNELQQHGVEPLAGAGQLLFSARRRATAEARNASGPPSALLRLEILYLVTAPVGACPAKVPSRERCTARSDMVKSFSEQMLARKREKVEDQVRTHVADWWKNCPFSAFVNKPLVQQAVDMFMAARFGPGDPLTAGGDLFAFEYMLDELSIALDTFRSKRFSKKARVIDPEAHAIRIVSSQSEDWANIMFVIDVDESLAKYWTRLKLDDFDYVYDGDALVYAVEKESLAFGFRVSASPLVPLAEAYAAYGDSMQFTPQYRPSPWKANDKCTIYFLTVGPLDRLLTPEERSKHGVQGFFRRVASGKVISVRPHERRNPRRLAVRAENLDEVGHVVYRAFDASGVLRYFGEGVVNRPGHVNSGVSHNFKLNEHFFKNGPMRVDVFARGLSKDEALAVERLCIRGHTGSTLWNIKDYEPRPEDDRSSYCH